MSYAHLLSWCRVNRFDWFRVLCDSGTVVMREFLKSKMWTDRNAIRSIQEGEDDD